MTVKASLKYLRMSPRKVRLVADLVRGRSVTDADKILSFVVKRSSDPVAKLLQSAVANAEHNYGIKKEKLYISEIKVDGGPTLKRFMPRARGSVSPIAKKTSHITVTLKERGSEKTERKGKREKIKRVYQQEKPKEGKSVRSSEGKDSTKNIPSEGRTGDAVKKKIFRRKSI